ncbi:MAG: hypothetical protein ACJ74U_07540 [Jatrophihabitantaceae bacterium]
MTSVLHAISNALLVAWLCTAVAWAAAGLAVASWGRLPLWAGALLGAAVPGLGVLALTVVAATRRRTGPRPRPGVPVGYPPAGMPTYPAPFDPPAAPAAAPRSLELAGEDLRPGFLSAGPPAESGLTQPLPGYPGPGYPGSRFPAPDAPAASGRRILRRRLLDQRTAFTGLALLIAISLLLTLFVSDWIRVGVANGVSFRLSAWDIGLGELVVLSALEFAVFAAVAWRWRTRWIGTLAVFAGAWWFLLWSVACIVGGGIRQLTRDTRAVRGLRYATLTAGSIWSVLLLLALLMVGWGVTQLVFEHLDSAERG